MITGAIYIGFDKEEAVRVDFEGNIGIPMVGSSSILSISPTYIPTGQTLGVLVDEIIRRESGGDPKICNRKQGCRAGMGLMGFISGTWNQTIKRMSEVEAWMPSRCWQLVSLPMSDERWEPVFDAECNRLAGTWLLRTDGIVHWEGDGTWGSGPYYIED